MYLLSIFLLLLPLELLGAATLNLPAAQSTSMTERPLLNAARQTIIASTKDEQRIQGQLFPQLSVSHSSTYYNPLGVNESAHTVTLQGSQLIFNAAGPLLQGEIASLTTARNTFQYQTSSQEIRYTVATNFLQAWLLQEKAVLIQALADYTDQLEQNNDQLLKTGSINTITWSATAATVAQNRAVIAAYPLAAQSALKTLKQSMGSHGTDIARLTYSLETPLPRRKAIDDYVALAYAHRPELKDKDAAVEQQTLIARSYRRSYLPTVSTQASLGNTFGGARIEQGKTVNIGVTLQWNLFDGFQGVRAAQAADANKLRTSFEKQELKNAIATNIANLYNTLCSNEMIAVATQKRKEAQQALLAQTTAAFATKTVDALVLAKDTYDYESAAHELRTQHITLHTNWQTLAWYCGYPTSGVLHES